MGGGTVFLYLVSKQSEQDACGYDPVVPTRMSEHDVVVCKVTRNVLCKHKWRGS